MAKKTGNKNKNSKSHIKQKAFKDKNFSPLERHINQNKVLKSPFSMIPDMKPSSWIDECVPNILWACILASSLERRHYLNLFRKVIINTREKLKDYSDGYLTHNYLAIRSEEDFDLMFTDILTDSEAIKHLPALLLVKSLPDKAHWQRHLKEPDIAVHGKILIKSVGECFDHQSEKSTDIRWMKVMHKICIGELHFPPSMADVLEEYRCFPDKGDMRKVRPSIRALEMSLRPVESGQEGNTPLPQPHQKQFWKDMLAESNCIGIGDANPSQEISDEIKEELFSVYKGLMEHFNNTLMHTSIDARHDSTFGLVLYAIALALNMAFGRSHELVEGRMILRTITEVFITLHFLKHKDDETIWMQHRNYGSAQTKLAFLKNVREEDVPDFIDLKRLEELANEDMWLEFQDIPLGSWANSNLREMATQSGVKDVYDKYYDWTSGYTHAHWVSIRDTIFDTCLNPLHRYHRILATPKMDMPTVIPDACKLINRMLDDVNTLYPGFKTRLKEYKNMSKVDKEVDTALEEATV